MKQYNRIIAGRGSRYVNECIAKGYIGVGFDIEEDLSDKLHETIKKFNQEFVPKYMAAVPDKSKTVAGLACGMLWTVCRGLQTGDIVLTPDGKGSYHVGEISSEYRYVPGSDLPHRRGVKWYDRKLDKKGFSPKLRNSLGSIGTCCNVTKYAAEIEELLGNKIVPTPAEPAKTESMQKAYSERDLHKLFCNYLRANGIYAKTIFHEKSLSKDSAQKWVHPDIVGAEFADFHKLETRQLLKATEPKKSVTLISYELKKKIGNDYDLKQYFFQALSNSNWANQGYLVAFDIDDSIIDEMKRLNEAFGIGVIHLQAKPQDTSILFQAREHELDYNTIDKLNNINPDFSTFVAKLTKVMLASNEYASDAKAGFEKCCDQIFDDDSQIEEYCRQHNIPF